MAAPATVYDLGCGDGRVTRLLANHWPGARITGVDNSANMLDAARKVLPDVTWIEADIAHWTPDAPAQVVFANASLQWLTGHDSLLPRLMDMVAPGGVLTVQMPRNHHKASHDCMRDAAAGPWRDRLAGVEGLAPVHEPEVYYDILAPHAASLNVGRASISTHLRATTRWLNGPRVPACGLIWSPWSRMNARRSWPTTAPASPGNTRRAPTASPCSPSSACSSLPRDSAILVKPRPGAG
jgi:trans-aconitate methyltransferase